MARVEALAKQVAMHAAEDRGVGQRRAGAQAASERLLEQFGLVNLRKDFGDCLARDVSRDPERFNLTDDSRAAAMLETHLGPRAGERGPAVVERPLAAQPRNGGVDVVVVEFAPGEPRPQLRFGKLTAGKKGKAGDVRPVGVVRHRR